MSADNNNPAPIPTPTPAPGLTEEQINARIEAARREEKQKLYSEMEGLKKKVSDSDLTSAEMVQLKTQLTEAQNQLTAIAKAKTPSGEIDTVALARQVAEETRRIVEAANNEKLTTMQKRLEEVESNSKKQQLAAYRTSVIAGYKGRIIEAMVFGGTEAEIKASAEGAAAQYEAIVEENGNKVVPVPGSSVPPPINPRAVSGNGQPPAEGVDAFKRTGSAAQFSSNRQKVLADVKARFG